MAAGGLVQAMRSALSSCQHYADDRPRSDQAREHPQEQGGLADRHPRGKLLAGQEEARAPHRPLVFGNLDDLARHSGGGVVGRTSVGGDEYHAPGTTLFGHADTVPQQKTKETPRRRRTRWLGAAGVASALTVAAAGLASLPSQASGGRSAELVLTPGDVVRVAGTPVGCRVVRRGVPPATMLDCRRAGPLRGTYGVLLGRTRVRVVRFASARDAQVVLTAKHGGRAVCCSAEGRP
jgi:hypothetical protein